VEENAGELGRDVLFTVVKGKLRNGGQTSIIRGLMNRGQWGEEKEENGQDGSPSEGTVGATETGTNRRAEKKRASGRGSSFLPSKAL